MTTFTLSPEQLERLNAFGALAPGDIVLTQYGPLVQVNERTPNGLLRVTRWNADARQWSARHMPLRPSEFLRVATTRDLKRFRVVGPKYRKPRTLTPEQREAAIARLAAYRFTRKTTKQPPSPDRRLDVALAIANTI